MADITMPKMGFDMTEGTIVRWLKKVGDTINKGEAIAEIETDKVTIEIESFASGTLSTIVAEEGAVVPVGATIAVLGGADTGTGDGAPAASTAGDSAPAAARTGPANPEASETGEGGEASSVAAAQTEVASGQTAGQPTGATDAASAPQHGYGSDVSTTQETQGAPAQAASGATPPAIGERIEPVGRADGEHIAASPVAKRLARENQIDIGQVPGSGPGGRVVKRDIEQFVSSGKQQVAQPAAQPAPVASPPAQPAAPQPAPQAEQRPGVRREPMSRLRQVIARRMAQSKGPVPHFYVTAAIDMGAALELRKQLNASGDVKITVNDMVIKAAALAVKKFPALNASFAEDALEYHDYVNVSVAIPTDTGLLAPALSDVDKKSLGTISAEAKELIGRTREGKATPDELQRGTFSVSNMGIYPFVDSFAAIINPPQAMILAVGAATEQPVVRNGAIAVAQIMKVTISIDHRVSDGVAGAEYLQELKRILENPMAILL